MANFNLQSCSDILVSSFGSQQSVTLKFYQPTPANKYYRLMLTASGVSPMFIYLGEFATTTQYVYTHTFRFSDTDNIKNGSLNSSSFEAYFRQYFTDNANPQFSVVLQSSSNSSFSSYTSTADSRTLSIRLQDNLNFKPSWVSPTYLDLKASVTGVATLTNNDDQKGVQSVSELQITFTAASPKYGATNKTYSASIDGGFSVSYTAAQIQSNPVRTVYLSNYPKLSGNLRITFSIEDSRGFVRSFTQRITIVPYTQIELTTNNTRRKSGEEMTVILDFAGKWHGSPLTLSCTQIVAYEEGSQTAFAALTAPTVTVSDNNFSYVAEWTGVQFDKEKAYTIKAEFTDTVLDINFELSIPVKTPVLAIRDKKVGINNPDPQSALDVVGTIQQNSLPVMGFMEEIGDDTNCNLNNYTQTGYYIYKGNSATVTNFPNRNANVPLMLAVISTGDYIIQKANFFASYASERTRSSYNGQWYYWST